MEEIKIIGNHVEVAERVVKKITTLDEIKKWLLRRNEFKTGIMPEECIYHSKMGNDGENNKLTIFMFKRDVKKIKHRDKKHVKNAKTRYFEIDVPAHLFVWNYNEAYLLFINKKIKTGEEEIFSSGSIANIYPNNKICWGDLEKSNPNISDKYKMSKEFWESEFNMDLTNDPYYDFVKWQKGTKNDDMFFTKLLEEGIFTQIGTLKNFLLNKGLVL